MKKRVTPEWIHDLAPNEVFVFGSNLGGMHGGGAARIAYRCFGAKMGVGVGRRDRATPSRRCREARRPSVPTSMSL